MGDVLKKFGRYFLLDHLAQGGMAEIYRARLASPEGGGRLLVIKRIQAGYGENSEFLQMFKSEIKVTMGFSHPNIVQLYDFGEENHQPYIAMELVDGKNVRQFMGGFTAAKKPFPVELAALIVEQAAAGLHYAHTFRDKITGEALNIVHRDISPQNILISFEGNVKVIDFGIAKATTNSEATRAGVIKGKPSYLSPEQISGEVLDGRSDVFALGAVLWELLVGKKLFAGDSDLAVLKAIESCQTFVKPPSTFNKNVPKELDYIVLRSLTKQRESRYQSAQEFQRALHKFLYSFTPDFNPADLSYYAKELFKDELVEDRKKIQRLNEKAELLLAQGNVESIGAQSDETGAEGGGQGGSTVVFDKKAVEGPRGHKILTAEDTASTEKIEIEPTHAGTPAGGTLSSGGLTGSISRPGGMSRGSTNPGMTHTLSSSSHSQTGLQRPPRKKIQSKSGLGLPKILSLGGAGVLLLAALGPEIGIRVPVLSDIISGPENASPGTAKLSPASQEAQNTKSAPNLPRTGSSILLKINLDPPGAANIKVNGQNLDPIAPVARVALDAPLELSVERPGYKPIHREFVLTSSQVGQQREWSMDAQLEPLQFGFLTIHTTPSADATIILDGIPWKRKTPIENEKFPIGNYTLRLTNEILGMEKILDIAIQEGKPTVVDERLEIQK